MMGYEPGCFVIVIAAAAVDVDVVVVLLVVESLGDVLLSLPSRGCSLMMVVLMLM